MAPTGGRSRIQLVHEAQDIHEVQEVEKVQEV